MQIFHYSLKDMVTYLKAYIILIQRFFPTHDLINDLKFVLNFQQPIVTMRFGIIPATQLVTLTQNFHGYS